MPYKTKEKKREWNKNYRGENKKHLKESRDRDNNKKKKKVYDKKYRRENKRKFDSYNHKYRGTFKGKMTKLKNNTKRRGIIHDFSSKEWLEKLRATNGICPDCNNFIGIETLTIDHIKPVSKAWNGEVYTIDDVRPLCLKCNIKKGNR